MAIVGVTTMIQGVDIVLMCKMSKKFRLDDVRNELTGNSNIIRQYNTNKISENYSDRTFCITHCRCDSVCSSDDGCSCNDYCSCLALGEGDMLPKCKEHD